jgi:hypothetical protein
MKQYVLKDGKTAYSYLEKGVVSNVIVTLVETTTPDVYASHRHSYSGGDMGASVFDAMTLTEIEGEVVKAETVSGKDEVEA